MIRRAARESIEIATDVPAMKVMTTIRCVKKIVIVCSILATMASLLARSSNGLTVDRVLGKQRRVIRTLFQDKTWSQTVAIITHGNTPSLCHEQVLTMSCQRHPWTRSQRTMPSGWYTTTTRRWMATSESSNHPMDQTSPSQPSKEKSKKKKNHKRSKSQPSFNPSAQPSTHQQLENKADGVDVPSKWDREAVRIEEETQRWVQRVVIGLNLCPLAAKPFADQQLYISVVKDSSNVVEVLQEVLAQSLALTDESDKQPCVPGTALLVCPDLFPDNFDEFLSVLTMIVDGLLEDFDLTGKVQVVPFHPKFVFAQAQSQDMDDSSHEQEDNEDEDQMKYYTNRSPYPMFHILKEVDVSHAVRIMKGDTDRVWQRNVYLLNALEQKCHMSNKSSSNQPHRQLQKYLITGIDNAEKSMRSLVKDALADTAREFPLLDKPIRDDMEQPASS